MTAPARGSAISLVCALLRESMLAWFAPATPSHNPLGGRVETVEWWPGANMQLPAAPTRAGERCAPIGSIQVIDTYPTTRASFPEADETAGCSEYTAVTLLVGIWRCGYTLETGGRRVASQRLEQWAKAAIDDEWRLRRAVCAALNKAAAVPPSPRAVGGGPAIAAGTVGTWTNDETAGGWLGGSRECKILIADGWT